MDVPEEDREAARQFYLQSIPSTKATLSQYDEALLPGLALEGNGAESRFDVPSDKLVTTIKNSEGLDLGEAWIGRRIRELGLLVDNHRVRGGQRRLMVWTIDGQRLKHQLKAWKIVDEPFTDS